MELKKLVIIKNETKTKGCIDFMNSQKLCDLIIE
jgi:hypothetical protein